MLASQFSERLPAPADEFEAAIQEAAFAIYWRNIREQDERRARERFSKLSEARLAEWIGDARASHRIFEIYHL